MIVDSVDLIRYFDPGDAGHLAMRGQIELAAGYELLVVSPFVVAELEPAVLERYGVEGLLAVLDELARGAWAVAAVGPDHIAAMRVHVAKGATLAAASVAVLAEDELGEE